MDTLHKELALMSLFSVLIINSGATHAQAGACLGYSAIACVPWSKAPYTQSWGRIKYEGSSTETIWLFCPVLDNGGGKVISWDSLKIRYKDPDGLGQDYQVKGALRYVEGSGPPNTVVEVDSNKNSSTDEREEAASFNHTFNFITRYYYMQLTLNRKNSAKTPEIAGFNLCHTP
jgi:hypothetical protein